MLPRATRPERSRTHASATPLYLGDLLADENGAVFGDEFGFALEAAHPAGSAALIDEGRALLTDELGLALFAS